MQEPEDDSSTTTMKEDTIQPNDVLFGRGAFTNNRPGNVLFRQLVAEAKEAYDEADRATVQKNKAKHDIAMNLVRIVREEYGGRFWKFVGTSGGTNGDAHTSKSTTQKSKNSKKQKKNVSSSDDENSNTTRKFLEANTTLSPTAACMEQIKDGEGKTTSSCWFQIVDDTEAAKKTKQALRDAKKSGAYISLHNSRKRNEEVQHQKQQLELYQQSILDTNACKRRAAAEAAAVFDYQQFYEAAQMMKSATSATEAMVLGGTPTRPNMLLGSKRSRFAYQEEEDANVAYELPSLPPVKKRLRRGLGDAKLRVLACISTEENEENRESSEQGDQSRCKANVDEKNKKEYGTPVQI